MASQSYWEGKHYFKHPDLCIIGAGFVGLNAGISYLELNPDAKVLILERSYLSSGASSKNAGFACFGCPTELLADLQNSSPENVFGLFKKRYLGIQSLLNKVSNNKIAYEKNGGYDVFPATAESEQIEQSSLDRLNGLIEEYCGLKNYFYFDDKKLNYFKLKGFNTIIANDYEALLNPVLVLEQLALKFNSLGGKILYGVNLERWNEYDSCVKLKCSNGLVFESHTLLLCINGFAKNFFTSLDVYPARNLVLVLKPKKELSIKGCFHADQGFIYFRNVDGHLLIGGARNMDEQNENTEISGINPKIEKYLMEFAQRHILDSDKFEIINKWSGIMGLGKNKRPIVQMHGKRLGIAVRLGGMGVALSSLVGEEAAAMMNKKL